MRKFVGALEIQKVRLNAFCYSLFFVCASMCSLRQGNAEPREILQFVKAGRDVQTQIKLPSGSVIGVKSLSKHRSLQRFANLSNSPLAATNDPSSLLVELPESLLTQSYVFGGVVTRLIDPKFDEDLGMAKISSFPESMARLKIDGTSSTLNILTCKNMCREGSRFDPTFRLPIVSRDLPRKTVTVDFAKLDRDLDIIGSMAATMQFPEQHVRTSFRVSAVDYSFDTLILETESKYLRKVEAPYEYSTRTRWYLKLTSSFDSAFTARGPTDGVGFFLNNYTDPNGKINRFSFSQPIKYYIKAVPSKYLQAFIDAIEDWNTKLASSFGKRLLEYEVLQPTDPRYDQVVAGDIRFNVIEWDLETQAPYGGFGPSFAHPITGQIYSGVTLIQGPKIEEIYTAWFNLKRDNSAMAQRQFQESTRFSKTIKRSRGARDPNAIRFPAFEQQLHDPSFKKEEFDLPPTEYSYEDYMYGYFREMVAHELGHNLGLRHNFKGNISEANSLEEGKVSQSVMEYLSRGFRYLNRVADYDLMAIQYGYLGMQPLQRDWYCTDEDGFSAEAPFNSAECSSNDGSQDPFGYFEKRLDRVYALLTNPTSDKASDWTFEQVQAVLPPAIEGLLSYAVSAPTTAKFWKLFNLNPERPTEPLDIPAYVLSRLQLRICNPNSKAIIEMKTTPEDKAITAEKIAKFQALFWEVAQAYNRPFAVVSRDQFTCLQGL